MLKENTGIFFQHYPFTIKLNSFKAPEISTNMGGGSTYFTQIIFANTALAGRLIPFARSLPPLWFFRFRAEPYFNAAWGFIF